MDWMTTMPRTRKPRSSQESPSCKFGAHMSISGGCDRAIRSAHAVGFETVQLFTKNNNQWKAPPLTDEHTRAFRAALDETGIGQPVAHTSYLINMASPDEVLWKKSIAAMIEEVERCHRLGIADLVVHPGAHMGAGEEAGLERVAAALDEVSARTAGLGVMIDLETTAGQGSSLGYRFEHLRAILNLVRDAEGLGVCVDTCHVFAAGYSLDTPERYDEVDQPARSDGGPGSVAGLAPERQPPRMWQPRRSARRNWSWHDGAGAVPTHCQRSPAPAFAHDSGNAQGYGGR